MEIFSNIQQFFVTLVTTVIATVMVVVPLNKPYPSPTPTPTPVQEVKEATSSSRALGITETPKDNKQAKNRPTPTPSTTFLPTQTPKPITFPTFQPQIQNPTVSIEAVCKGYRDETEAALRTTVGGSQSDWTGSYYNYALSNLYNYCLSHGGNMAGYEIPKPPTSGYSYPYPTPETFYSSPYTPDNSWQQTTCTEGIKQVIADLERKKQELINETTVIAQRECERRGYAPPDYGSCKALIDQRVADSLTSSSYD